MKGRGNSHAITTNEALRLEINKLVKTKCLIKDKVINYTYSWTNGSKMTIQSVYNDSEIYLHLMYNITDRTTKESKAIDYKIFITKVKSNLGKGHNLYFYCPESGIRCKILYFCYGSERFKCRQAYNNRIYYFAQTHSKEYRLNGRYFHLEKKINELYEKRDTTNYKGKPTKRKLRLNELLNKKAKVDNLRNQYFEKWLLKYIGA